MHSINFVKSFEPVENLLQKISGFVFGQSFFLFKVTLKVTSVAVLHGDELCFFRNEGIDIANDIFIMALFKNSNFCLHKLS